MKRRLSVLLATALMLSATVVSGPASALPPGNNGHHYGDIYHEDNGEHNGAGAGLGNVNAERRGLR